MSSSAIMGYVKENGHFVGGWQWNDAQDLQKKLNKYINTLEKVDALIYRGVWNNIVFPGEKSKRDDFVEKTLRPKTPYHLELVDNILLLKEKPDDDSAKCFEADSHISVESGILEFNSIEDALGQDIVCLYEFMPNVGKWVDHR